METKKEEMSFLNAILSHSAKQLIGTGLFFVIIFLGLGSRVSDFFKKENPSAVSVKTVTEQTCQEKTEKHFNDYPKQEFVLRDKKSGIEKTYQVWIANTNERRILGLSNTECLPAGTGLLFEFEKPEVQFFWMKDMNYPLDIIWLDSNKKEVGRASNVTPESYPNTVNSEVPVNYVLEINPENN